MQRERNNDVHLCICEWETQKRGRSFADAATFELWYDDHLINEISVVPSSLDTWTPTNRNVGWNFLTKRKLLLSQSLIRSSICFNFIYFFVNWFNIVSHESFLWLFLWRNFKIKNVEIFIRALRFSLIIDEKYFLGFYDWIRNNDFLALGIISRHLNYLEWKRELEWDVERTLTGTFEKIEHEAGN